jgi:hypothetical protein
MPTIDRRSAIVLVLSGAFVLVASGVLLDRVYRDPTFLKPHDFLQYWAAGRLNAAGGNPYDAAELFAVQRAAGRPDPHPVLMWNPPWALALTMPVGLLSPRTAQLVWILGQLAVVVAAAAWLWRLYEGDPGKWWVGGAVAVLAPMTAANLVAGQSAGWLLLGLVGFLASAVRGKPALAAFAALCALKPHLFVPFWIALVLDATRSRPAALRLGFGLLAGIAATLIPFAANPDVGAQYFAALANPGGEWHVPLSAWQPPLVGYWLRVWTDPAAFWVQFVPTALVVLLTPLYWWRRRDSWDWREELPRVILAGAFAAPYGAWDYDLVILLVPIVAAAARLSKATRTARTVAVAGAALFILAASQIEISLYYFWMTPAVILGYVWAMRVNLSPSSPPSRFGKGAGGLGPEDTSPTTPRNGEGLPTGSPADVEAAPCP